MKKLFSFVLVLAAVVLVSCGGNTSKPAETVVEAEATEVVAGCDGCTEKCDSTAACCEKGDSTAACCEKAGDACCNE